MAKRNRKTDTTIGQDVVAVRAPEVVVATPDVVTELATAAVELVKPRKSIVPEGYREACHKDKAKRTAGGNISVDCNDQLAQYLKGRTVEDVAGIAAKALGVEASALLAKYAHLNLGQKRMNLGNRLRSAMKDGLWSVPVQQ